MTPDQIRQIAEEYLTDAFKGKPVSKSMAGRAIFDFIEFLAERYCVVERSKVVE